MRSDLLAHHLRALSKASALFIVAVSAAACSNDASRLDQFLTASTKVSSNQKKIIKKTDPLNQAFPNDAKRALPLASAAKHVAPTVARGQLPKVTATQPLRSVAAAKVAKPALQQGVPAGALVLAPRKQVQNPLRIAGADKLTTGSIVAAPAQKVVTAAKPEGWNNTKGARISVKPGETLYNISRRYGVPVSAIMKANNITDAGSVTAGSRILIPAYNYSASVPVSAPDNDPTTRASRASRGFQGQVRGKITVPKKRGKRDVVAKVSKPAVPVSQGGQGVYTVTSGDSVYGIAKRHNISAVALREANNFTGNDLKIGQKLQIPAYGSRKTLKTAKNIDANITGSISPDVAKAQRKTTKFSAPKVVPSIKARSGEKVASLAKTSASAFRWPVKGRVITKFGERDASGTNDGIDISVPIGTPIKATENGTVIYSGSELEDFGKLILVSHQGGWVSAYAHASAALVRRGDKVRRGQVIAKSGRTGNATKPKLHFELRKDSNPVNPLKHLAR